MLGPLPTVLFSRRLAKILKSKFSFSWLYVNVPTQTPSSQTSELSLISTQSWVNMLPHFFLLTLPFLLFRLPFVRVFACFVSFSLYLTLRNENRKQLDSTFVIITHHPRRIYQWILWDKGICRIRWYWRMFRHSYKDFPSYIHRCLQHNLVRLWCYQLGYRGM